MPFCREFNSKKNGAYYFKNNDMDKKTNLPLSRLGKM